jgi:single-strand DNA-binding protein
MASLNKILLIGHLGKDPEIRYTPDGAAVASFSIATSENFTDKNGTRQERTEWHSVKAFGKLADICKQYLTKGRQVYIEGRIQTREYTDREGIKRRFTEVLANQMIMLGSRSQGADAGVQPMESVARPVADADQAFGDPGITDNDIPF